MLISFLKKGVYGYLRDDHLGIHSFVSNNNLAVRKTFAARAGGYRDELRIAEDYDLCQRVAAAGGLLYFCPEVALEHRARGTTEALLRQWWSYGFHLARNHQRFHPGRLIVAVRPPRWEDREAGEPVRASRARESASRAPTALVFVSPFVLLHVLAAAWIVCWLAGADVLATVAGVATSLAAVVYVAPDLRHVLHDGLRASLGLCALRYLVNLTFVGAGIAGGLTCGSLYLLPPISARLGPVRRRVDVVARAGVVQDEGLPDVYTPMPGEADT